MTTYEKHLYGVTGPKELMLRLYGLPIYWKYKQNICILILLSVFECHSNLKN